MLDTEVAKRVDNRIDHGCRSWCRATLAAHHVFGRQSKKREWRFPPRHTPAVMLIPQPVHVGQARPERHTLAKMAMLDAHSARLSMYNDNALKLGLFGANCSSGRAATTVPERWSGSWEDNVRLAEMADAAGIDFMLPIRRWKGYGGETNFEGATFETITWACGLLANTKRLNVFGTVHAPLLHPIYAAKAMVTADHAGHGRFGLNVVCGWNRDEFQMFGVDPLGDEERYAHGKEWLDAIKTMWGERAAFTFNGRYFHLTGVQAQLKPFGDTRPIIMNAGTSPAGRLFGAENCDVLFTLAAAQSFRRRAGDGGDTRGGCGGRPGRSRLYLRLRCMPAYPKRSTRVSSLLR